MISSSFFVFFFAIWFLYICQTGFVSLVVLWLDFSRFAPGCGGGKSFFFFRVFEFGSSSRTRSSSLLYIAKLTFNIYKLIFKISVFILIHVARDCWSVTVWMPAFWGAFFYCFSLDFLLFDFCARLVDFSLARLFFVCFDICSKMGTGGDSEQKINRMNVYSFPLNSFWFTK